MNIRNEAENNIDCATVVWKNISCMAAETAARAQNPCDD
jgi:hypothetical protein